MMRSVIMPGRGERVARPQPDPLYWTIPNGGMTLSWSKAQVLRHHLRTLRKGTRQPLQMAKVRGPGHSFSLFESFPLGIRATVLK